jgi:hypothetical protein
MSGESNRGLYSSTRIIVAIGDEGVLREFFGQADVAPEPRQAGGERRRPDPPDRLNGAMGVDSRDGYRSYQLPAGRTNSGRSRLLLRVGVGLLPQALRPFEVFGRHHVAKVGHVD